jgi:hypothetical protein
MPRHKWTIPPGSEGFQTIVRDSAWLELAALPPGEERTRWITATLAERGTDTARQRMWRRVVEEDLPHLQRAAQDHDWAATSGEGLVVLIASQEDLFECSRGLSADDAPYLLSMRIYENAEALSPQHAELTLRGAWTCVYFGFGAKAESATRAAETRPDGTPTARALAVKAVYNFLTLHTRMPVEQRDHLFRHEQADLTAAWGDLSGAMFLVLDQRYGTEATSTLLSLLALALDGQLDTLDQQTRQWMERQTKRERGGLPPVFRTRAGEAAFELLDDPGPMTKAGGRFVRPAPGRFVNRLPADHRTPPLTPAFETPPPTPEQHTPLDVLRLEVRDARLHKALADGAPVTESFARTHGFGSAQEIRHYMIAMDRAKPALDRLDTSSLHAAILGLDMEKMSLDDIAATLSLGNKQNVSNHLTRICAFLQNG